MNFLNKIKIKAVVYLILLCGASSTFAGIGDFFEGESGVFTLIQCTMELSVVVVSP